MQINPVVTQANGVISVRLQALFIGDTTDLSDKALIAAYGDPQVSLVGNGTFTGPVPEASPPATFSFTFPTSEFYVGITTKMSSNTVRFMTSLPSTPAPVGSPVHSYTPWCNPNSPAGMQGPLDCITIYPAAALDIWYSAMLNEITAALTALRNQPLPGPLTPVDI
jgi:hypothetical protein